MKIKKASDCSDALNFRGLVGIRTGRRHAAPAARPKPPDP
jgi:hypothetical protein